MIRVTGNLPITAHRLDRKYHLYEPSASLAQIARQIDRHRAELRPHYQLQVQRRLQRACSVRHLLLFKPRDTFLSLFGERDFGKSNITQGIPGGLGGDQKNSAQAQRPKAQDR